MHDELRRQRERRSVRRCCLLEADELAFVGERDAALEVLDGADVARLEAGHVELPPVERAQLIGVFDQRPEPLQMERIELLPRHRFGVFVPKAAGAGPCPEKGQSSTSHQFPSLCNAEPPSARARGEAATALGSRENSRMSDRSACRLGGFVVPPPSRKAQPKHTSQSGCLTPARAGCLCQRPARLACELYQEVKEHR